MYAGKERNLDDGFQNFLNTRLQFIQTARIKQIHGDVLHFKACVTICHLKQSVPYFRYI